MWGGRSNALPGLRSALGLKEDADLATVDAIEAAARALVEAADAAGWAVEAIPGVVEAQLGQADPAVGGILEFAATEIVPRLAATTDELTSVLHALDGGFVTGRPVRVHRCAG